MNIIQLTVIQGLSNSKKTSAQVFLLYGLLVSQVGGKAFAVFRPPPFPAVNP